MDHPSLTHPQFTTVILSWFDGGLHFFEAPPVGAGTILLETYYLSYFLCIGLSFWLSLYWQKKGEIKLKRYQVYDLMLVAILGIFIGARVFYVLFYNLEFYLKNPLQILGGSGMASHGAIAGTTLGIFLYCYRSKISFMYVLDRGVIYAALGAIFIRPANWLNAELYGRSAPDFPLSMRFPMRDGVGRPLFVNSSGEIFALERSSGLSSFIEPVISLPSHAYESFQTVMKDLPHQIYRLPVGGSEEKLELVARLITDPSHQSQFYQMILSGFILFILMCWLKGRAKLVGTLSGFFFIFYGLSRLAMEFFRQPDVQRSEGLFQYFSMGQWLSLVIILTGTVIFAWQRRRPQLLASIDYR